MTTAPNSSSLRASSRSAGSVTVTGPLIPASVMPARRKIDRIRVVAYCRYGPVFPRKEIIRSQSKT